VQKNAQKRFKKLKNGSKKLKNVKKRSKMVKTQHKHIKKQHLNTYLFQIFTINVINPERRKIRGSHKSWKT